MGETMRDENEFTPIPADFWWYFGERKDARLIAVAEHPKLGLMRKWSDNIVTTENWEDGDFAVYDLQPDGNSIYREGYRGIQFNRNDLMRLFPPKDPS